MDTLSIIIALMAAAAGTGIGYAIRQSIAKRRAGTLEAKLQKRVQDVKDETAKMVREAEQKSSAILDRSQKDLDERRKEFVKTQEVLLNREKLLNDRISSFEEKEKDLQDKGEKLKSMKEALEKLRGETEDKLAKVAGLTREEAKSQLLELVEQESERDVLERIHKLERQGHEKVERRAKEMIALAIQKCASPHTQEMSTATVVLQNEEIKGKIIGKEGRNIKTFEKMTGVELIIDEAPDTVVISCFNPIRRQIAKVALEKLIADGRIQPAKIEEKVQEATAEISKIIKDAGEKAILELGIVGMNDKLVQVLGRLYYRTSYGQNVLLHSMEMALIAETLAFELGANSQVAKRAALLHDIGKAIDQQVQGSHIEIGIKLLEKFGESEEIVKGMRAHHGDYPTETLEAAIVNTADAISGSRPGARKDTLENYLQRLKDLEDIANKFGGVEKTYAIQAGREIRVFVKADQVNDLQAAKMAKEIAKKIEEELKYPGEIKVTLIRENRVVEYAK